VIFKYKITEQLELAVILLTQRKLNLALLLFTNPMKILLTHPNNILPTRNSNYYLNSHIFRNITNFILFSNTII
jgi:hypothetical protein